MEIRVMRLVTVWLVASAEVSRVHGASAPHGATGVQRTAANKRGRESGREVNIKKAATVGGTDPMGDVCSAGDSAATCQELTEKYRGGGEFVQPTYLP